MIFRLILTGLLPILFAIGFEWAEKKTSFGNLSHKIRQLVIGVSFGLLAVFSTEFSIEIGGAAINVRDAAPLIAGLLFGGPAGIIAGLIGGIERWFASLWGIGVYTRLACTLATIMAGFVAAIVRKFLLDNKKPSWSYGLAIGVTVEILHMLLVFVTNMSDLHYAFSLVQKCAGIMITANGIVVMLASLVVSLHSKKKMEKTAEVKKIAQTFQLWLMICVSIAFIVTCVFSYSIQNRLAEANTDELLQLNIQDVYNDILDASDENLIDLTYEIAEQVSRNTDRDILCTLAVMYDVAEINIIDENGIITVSTYQDFINYDMADGEQSAYFLPLLSGTKELAQDYQPTSFDSGISRKYAGVALDGGGFVQVGYDAKRFQADIDEHVVSAAKNRHIGQNGCMIICDENWKIVSDRDGHEGENLQNTGIWIDTEEMLENTKFIAEVYGVSSYCMYTTAEGYYIISVLPVTEALFSRNVAIYLIVFMEILVFAVVFAFIYVLIKKLVVDNIQKINETLAEITDGNLDVTVDVRGNEEFASLSDDINATVITLKRYIAEAAERIDAELEFAKSIQHSSLPSVFPPYPNRKDFDIFASMNTAKEVGGDFYDFYLLNENQLAFLVADVSGKGIPAAMFMMKAKTIIKDLTESGMDVAQVFTDANDKLCEGNDANMFVTAWMGILDLSTGHLTYANAGHNPPVIKRKNGSFEYHKSSPDFVLGGMEGIPYHKQELCLEPGDVIYLFTDGVTESQDKEYELFGEERLLRCLNGEDFTNMECLCKKVAEALEQFVGDAEQFDDITMLALRVEHLKSNNV